MGRGIVKKGKTKRQYNFDPTTLTVEPKRRKAVLLKGTKVHDFDDLDEPDNNDDLQHIPRSFVDMIQRQNEQKSKSKSSKQSDRSQKQSSTTKLQIQPGESMAQFNRRVDEALPIIKARSGVPSKADLKKKKKKEKAAKNQKQDDENNDDEEEEKPLKKGKRDTSPDPWAHLESKKEKPKFNETADRPPDLRLPSKLLKNVPKSAGSLAKRQMLEEERERVISSYRMLMERKRKEQNESEE